jgi:ABC-type glycerol-3-phosphate transport system substrate-binding protein
MSRNAQTIVVTFYAFKGGTGRTLALSNVARFLADHMGYRVGVVDFDLESPGLIYEPLCKQLDPGASRTKLLKDIDGQDGFLNCFLDRLAERQQSIDNYVYSLNSGSGGTILLMPSAKGSVDRTREYVDTVEQFATKTGHNADTPDMDFPHSPLVNATTFKILSEFSTQYQLDFLLLDGRTGSGPFSRVYLYSIPHVLVLFFGLNDQNILGSLSIFKERAKITGQPLPAILVASPVPTVGPEELENRLHFVVQQLDKFQAERKPKAEIEAKGAGAKEQYVYSLPKQVDHMLPYSDAASFREVYFPGPYPNSLLAKAYRKLALTIEGFSLEKKWELESKGGARGSSVARPCASPVRIELEATLVGLLNKTVEKDSANGLFDFVGRAAEDKNATWERLFNAKDKDINDDLLSTLPDVLVVPQSYLKSLSERCSGNLLREISDSTLSQGTSEALDFVFLDTNYPNWRRWCTVKQRVMALPFSVSAMLLCANKRILTRGCTAFWTSREQTPPEPFFLPSSWGALVELIKAWPQDDRNYPFRIVGKRRGLYYEWLNVVASLGGFDLIQPEGRYTQDVTIADTTEATKLFVELVRSCDDHSRKDPADTMEAQIETFAKGRLALYVGWTDSLQFDWDNGQVNRATIGSPNGDRHEVRLGYCPRDMRSPRTSLVDGWLMTFPDKSARTTKGKNDRKVIDALQGPLSFASWFLNPGRQQELLSSGFPSPSRRAVRDALNAQSARRLLATKGLPEPEVSYEVFLNTMWSAISGGRWVASMDTLVLGDIITTLSALISRNETDVARAMKELDGRVRKAMMVPRRRP